MARYIAMLAVPVRAVVRVIYVLDISDVTHVAHWSRSCSNQWAPHMRNTLAGNTVLVNENNRQKWIYYTTLLYLSQVYLF